MLIIGCFLFCKDIVLFPFLLHNFEIASALCILIVDKKKILKDFVLTEDVIFKSGPIIRMELGSCAVVLGSYH